MARRSSIGRDELKRRMISAVRDIVTEGGLTAVSARELAKRVDYSTGTIYSIFSNLDEIIFHVEIELLESLEDTLLSVDSSQAPLESLLEFTRVYIDFISENFNLWHLIVEHRLSDKKKLPDLYPEKLKRIHSLFEERLKPFVEQDILNSIENPSFVFLSGLDGLIIFSNTNKLDVLDMNVLHKRREMWVKAFVSGFNSYDRKAS